MMSGGSGSRKRRVLVASRMRAVMADVASATLEARTSLRAVGMRFTERQGPGFASSIHERRSQFRSASLFRNPWELLGSRANAVRLFH